MNDYLCTVRMDVTVTVRVTGAADVDEASRVAEQAAREDLRLNPAPTPDDPVRGDVIGIVVRPEGGSVSEEGTRE